MGHEKIQTACSVGGLIIAIIALLIAVVQLGGMYDSMEESEKSLGIMNEQLNIQINESEKTTKLLNQTLWENRKMDFDRHTSGAVYIWGNSSVNQSDLDELNWTENVSLVFSNNFSYTVLEEVEITIEFSEGNFTNYSCSPRVGIKERENNSIDPPYNLTRVVWGSIGAKENITLSFSLNWSREEYDSPVVYPAFIKIVVHVRGDTYSIDELPIYVI